jgi:hypothetical protein
MVSVFIKKMLVVACRSGNRDTICASRFRTQTLHHAGLDNYVSSALLGAMRSLLSKHQKGRNKMSEQLNEIVLNNYCRYDLHSGCVKREPDAPTCATCVAGSASEIVRIQL